MPTNCFDLQPLHEKAAQQGVGFTVAYSDATMSWSLSIDSVAPAECFFCEGKTFDYVIGKATEWMAKLGDC